MADTSRASKNGKLTRGKAILMGVLALVLCGILYLQFGRGGGGEGAGAEGVAYMPRRPVPAAIATTTPETGAKINTAVKLGQADHKPLPVTMAVMDDSRWKSPPLVEVVSYDPFAVPAVFPKMAVADPTQPNQENIVAAAAAEDQKKLIDAVAHLQMQLEQIRQRGVQVIVKEGGQYAAMIGDQTVRVGEDLGNGFTVTGIDQSGVRVERKATQ